MHRDFETRPPVVDDFFASDLGDVEEGRPSCDALVMCLTMRTTQKAPNSELYRTVEPDGRPFTWRKGRESAVDCV